jgi:hypothetical protein
MLASSEDKRKNKVTIEDEYQAHDVKQMMSREGRKKANLTAT